MSDMEQIVYLDPEDDIRTIRERLELAQAERVVLVLPDGQRCLRSEVHVRLLARQAVATGLEILLVTRDRAVVENARRERIPVFATVEQSQRYRGKKRAPKKEQAKPKPRSRPLALLKPGSTARHRLRNAIIALALFVVLVLVLAATAFVVIPEARVTLSPATVDVSAELTVRVSTDVEDLDEATSTVPASDVRVDIQGKAQIAVTSKRDVADAKATGRVVLTNRTAEEVTIGRGVVVATSSGVPVRFQITETTTLPGAIGAQVDVGIEAQDPGPQGNVDAFMVNRVEGILGARLAVVNDEPTTGGTLKQASVVSAEDRTRVRAMLLQRLQQEGINRIKDELDPQDIVVLESVALIPLSETYDKFIDEPAEQLELAMRVVVRALTVSGKDANLLAVRALELKVPEGMDLVASTLQFQVGQFSNVEDESAEFPIYVKGSATANLDTNALTRGIVGKPLPDALQYLSEHAQLAEPPSISVQPDWLERVPLLAFRVRMDVAEETE